MQFGDKITVSSGRPSTPIMGSVSANSQAFAFLREQPLRHIPSGHGVDLGAQATLTATRLFSDVFKHFAGKPSMADGGANKHH